jgi:hypothetical protein
VYEEPTAARCRPRCSGELVRVVAARERGRDPAPLRRHPRPTGRRRATSRPGRAAPATFAVIGATAGGVGAAARRTSAAWA